MRTLVGREAERAAIAGLMAGAASGAGGTLILCGEAGIGKSALLADAVQRAGEALVLQAVGVEPESALAYAGLHRLLRPVIREFDGLPAPQAQALGVALGQRHGPPPDRFLVAVAVVTLLSDVAGSRPLLCVVDDAHWVDAPTADVLAFVGRRLGAEPVALVLAARDGEGRPVDTAGMNVLRVGGLPPAAAGELLATVEPALPPETRADVARASGGNPLALLELPNTVVRRAAAAGGLPSEPVRLSEPLIQAFAARVVGQPPQVQALLLLAAAAGEDDLGTLRDAATVLHLDASLLETPELTGLISVDGQSVTFRHPLIRSAVYQTASPGRRREAHRALARVLSAREPDADRQAWHHAQAADGPDEVVAQGLAAAAARTLDRAGPAAAATLLTLAAELSPAEVDRHRRMIAAADAAWRSGDTALARRQLDRLGDNTEAEVRIDAAYVRCLIESRSGIPADAVERALPVLAEAVNADADRAIRLIVATGEAAFSAGRFAAMMEMRAFVDRLDAPSEARSALLLRLLRQVSRPLGEPHQPGIRTLIEDVARLDDPDLLVRAGGMAARRGDHATARRLWTQAEGRARALGAAGVLPWALASLAADDLVHGRYRIAAVHADEGARLARETGQSSLAFFHVAVLAELAAVQGRADLVRSLVDRTLPDAAARGLVHVTTKLETALGVTLLLAGRPAEASDRLADLWARARATGMAEYLLPLVPDLAEAAVRARQPDRARQAVSAYVSWAGTVDSAPGHAVAARCRALLSDGDEAGGWYRIALDRHTVDTRPLDQGRTELLYGEHLRRAKRRSDARTHLRSALATFERLGAGGWVDRAHAELRATGETARRRDASTLDTLTPQELQIARAVATGATNREVAAQLFLSPRTVDYHLRKVFQKVGITSRVELIKTMPAD